MGMSRWANLLYTFHYKELTEPIRIIKDGGKYTTYSSWAAGILFSSAIQLYKQPQNEKES